MFGRVGKKESRYCPKCRRIQFGLICFHCDREERMGITAHVDARDQVPLQATGNGKVAEPVSATPLSQAPEPSRTHVHASAHVASVTEGSVTSVTCIVCHTPFVAKSARAKTCSPKCRKQASRLLT